MPASELQRGSPYQGLIPYDEADAPFFFGREKEARLIIANLYASPLTLLYGASGVGKSSVLRAGVAHQLRAREELLVVVFNAWQSNPVVDLQNKIAEAAGRLNVRVPAPSDSTPLSDFLAQCSTHLDRRLMIILDQFEEYFLYHPQEDEFAAEFSRAVAQAGTEVSFLISIREDFYAKLDRFEGRIPTLYDNYLRIEHLDRPAARVAIEKPIAEYNRLYTTNGQFGIEPGLVEAVLRQVETGRVIIGEAGRGVVETAGSAPEGAARIETPFLQLVMTRLWEKESGAGSHNLRLQTLDDLGGAENIVRTHLDGVITKLSEREQEIAAGIFHYLVTPSGTKIAYTASDLAGSAELKEAEVVHVLDKLSHGDVRILRTVEPSPDRPTSPRYEIFHDVLAPAILTWRTAYVQAQERADAERRAAEQKKRADEQARVAGRFRRLAIALGVVILLALGAVVMAVAQTVRAQQNALRADNYARESEKLRVEGQQLRDEGARLKASGDAARHAAMEANAQAQRERVRTEEQIKIAEQRKAEAEQAQGIARAKSFAAATANVAARDATEAAEQQAQGTRVAFANLLSVQSKTLLDEHPQLGTLLAVEALQATRGGDPPVPAAEESLRQTLARTGGKIFSSEDWDKDEGSSVRDVSVSPDGRWLVSASASKVRLFERAATDSKGPARVFEGATSPVVFSPDGRWLIAAGRKENPPDKKKGATILLWAMKDVASSSQPIILDSSQTQLEALMVSADSRWLVSGNSVDPTLIVWDLKSPTLTAKSLVVAQPPAADGARNSLITLAISSDSRWLVTSSGVAQARTYISGPGTVKLWDLAALDRGAQPLQLVGHKYSVTETAFSTDGRWLATGTVECDDGVRLWDLKAADPASKPIVLDHKGSIGAIAFSPSNQWLVTGSGSRERCSSDLRARVWSMENINSAAKPYLLPARGGPIFTIAFSPDEAFLITVVGRGYSEINSPLNSFKFVQIRNARSLGNLGLEGGATVHGWVWQQMLEGDDTGQDVADVTLNLPRSADSIVISPDSRWLVAQDTNKVLALDLTAGSGYGWPMLTMRGHDSSVSAMDFSTDNQWLVTGGLDKTARLWNLASNGVATPLTLAAHTPSASNPREDVVVQSPDRRLLVATTDEPSPPGESEGSPETYARFSSVALVSNLKSADPSKALVVRGHKGKIKSATFSSDNRWLATGSNDKTARLWDLTASDPAARALVFSHQSAVDDVAISADKHWLATATHDGGARLWDLTATDPTARPVVLDTFKNPAAETYTWTSRVYISPDSRWLVTGASYQWASARLWDLKASDPSASFTEIGKIDTQSFGCAFSPDGRWLIVSRDLGVKDEALKNDVHLWDLTRKPLAPPFALKFGPGKFISSAAFSSDGRWLFTSGFEKMIRRWNLTAADPTAAPLLLNSPISEADESLSNIALSPDNRWLIASSKAAATHILWDLKATDPNSSVRVLKNDNGYGISNVAFDPQSRWVITSTDGSLSDVEGFYSKREPVAEGHNIRWDLTTPDPSVAPVRLPGGRLVGDTAVSADGRWMITAGSRGLQFWNLRRDDLLDLACRTAGRNLSEEEWKTYFPGQPYRKTCSNLPARE